MNTIHEASEIKSLRERLELTQQEFAKRLGVDTSTLRNWETGRNKPLRAMRRRMGRILYHLERKAERTAAP